MRRRDADDASRRKFWVKRRSLVSCSTAKLIRGFSKGKQYDSPRAEIKCINYKTVTSTRNMLLYQNYK
jgi:hypothetical protein